MAAVRSPLMPSPSSGLPSAFSPYTESPSSPAAAAFGGRVERSSTYAFKPLDHFRIALTSKLQGLERPFDPSTAEITPSH
jgi:hypothetical protein